MHSNLSPDVMGHIWFKIEFCYALIGPYAHKPGVETFPVWGCCEGWQESDPNCFSQDLFCFVFHSRHGGGTSATDRSSSTF